MQREARATSARLRPPARDQPGGERLAHRVRAEALVAAAAAIVFGWQVGSPSMWRDEAATLSVCRRGLTELLRVLRSADLVHGGYYLLTYAVLRLDDTVTAVRLLSVLAFTLTAVFLVRIGRQIGSTVVGVTAACLLIASPLASRYAQDARPFALVTLLATASTSALLSALLGSRGLSRWRWYAASLVALGVINVLAILLVFAHGITVLALARRARLPETGPSVGRVAIGRWALSTAAALVVLAPFLVLTWAQRAQVAWITVPHVYDLTGFYVQIYQSRIPLALAALATVAIVAAYRAVPQGPTGTALVLGVAWAGGPPLALWLISQLHPLWDLHYVIFCLPGAMLFLAGLPQSLVQVARPKREAADRGVRVQTTARAGTLAAALAVLIAAGSGLSQQAAYRDAGTGHGENLRAVAGYLRTHAAPGDAVVYSPPDLRLISDVYPQSFSALDDVALAQGERASHTINGVEVTAPELAVRLGRADRVWLLRVLDMPTAAGLARATLGDLGTGFHRVPCAVISSIEVTLYVRAVPTLSECVEASRP